MFLATFEENYSVFDKLRKHFAALFEGRLQDETQSLYLVTMGVSGPWLNRTLAEGILGAEAVAGIIDT